MNRSTHFPCFLALCSCNSHESKMPSECCICIPETPITLSWLQTTLQNILKTKSSIQNCTSEVVETSRGAFSKMIQLQLKWDMESPFLPESLVLKLPTKTKIEGIEQSFQSSPVKDLKKLSGGLDAESAHHSECSMYDLFQQKAVELPLPLCYKGVMPSKNYEGLLLLEDLSYGKRGFLVKGFNVEQLMELSEHLATLHAFSLQGDSWKQANNKLNESKLANAQLLLNFIKRSVMRLKELWSDDDFSLLGDKVLSELCKSTNDLDYICSLHVEMDIPAVLCHGDLCIGNVVFEKEPAPHILAIIDWQISHPGSIGEDFARIFTSSVETETRRENYLSVLNNYYKSLTEILGQHPPFSFDKLVQNYKRCFKCEALIMIPNYVSESENGIGAKKLRHRCKAMLEDALDYENQIIL